MTEKKPWWDRITLGQVAIALIIGWCIFGCIALGPGILIYVAAQFAITGTFLLAIHLVNKKHNVYKRKE